MKKNFLIIVLLFSYLNLSSQVDIEKKISELISEMTLEEKIGQMNQYNGFGDATGPQPNGKYQKMKYDHLKNGLVGSILNVTGVEKVRKFQELAVNESRLGIPLIFGLDVIHGYKTAFPIPLAEAASWDLELIEKAARVSAIEASSVGLNWTFAPMVDITRDARWGRVMEGAGEDTYLASEIGVARLKGFQGDNLSASNTIAACAKHFVGYGFAESGKDYNTVDVGTATLYNTLLPPFKALVDNDCKSVMNAFNVLNGVPATGNKFLQRDILKEKWGFKGFVVSDWASIAEMIPHGFATDLKQTAELAVLAGSDMDMESFAYISHIKELIEEGKVDMSLIDDAVARILRVKFELGLFDDPYKYCNKDAELNNLLTEEHQQAALDMALNSIVLLKNKNNLLPLKKNKGKIALIGALANNKNSPLGNWRAHVKKGSAISVFEGMNSLSNNIEFAQGVKLNINEPGFLEDININNSDTSGFYEAISLAKRADVVVMVLGEHCMQTGEGRSRTTLNLPGLQQQLLEEVYKVNHNIVLVLMNGRPLSIPWADKYIPSIVEAWHLGVQSGNAIAKVLFGDHNPSGKLPMTFPRSVGQVPLYYNYFNTGRPVSAGSACWSHYIDESKSPLYPFGYGLSFTDFKYSNLDVLVENKKVHASVLVSNTGKYEGKEVVQLYLRDKVASIVRPVKELKRFKKINLKPGQKMMVSFTLSEKDLGFFNSEGEFVVEPGEFDIMVGGNSAEGLLSSFKINDIN